MKILLICIICIFNVVIASKISYRLPTTVFPSHYQIELKPYFEHDEKQFTFDGKSEIILQTTSENINQIVLNANKLNISLIKLSNGSENNIPISSNYSEFTQKLTIQLTTTSLIPNVNYTLAFKYIGILDTDRQGFFRFSYMENGVLKLGASTQMEPTSARRVFPCFDEPSFKATFNLILNRPAHFQPSVSNTILVESKQNGKWVREIFQKTLKMSTYLLAFIVSELIINENKDQTFGIVSRPQAFNQTRYGLDFGPKMLSTYNEWTQYNLSALLQLKRNNMAAIPYFSDGAMENWGLITYGESSLLYDPNETSIKKQQTITTAISHELSHYWFGNLVTCDWWSHLWLNEGFATYFTYLGTAMVKPTWDLEYQFVVEQLQHALQTDASVNSHALSHEVNSPEEIWTRFSTISYNKGGSVIRMLTYIMGLNNFHHALMEYLSINAFGMGTPEKLYHSLQKYTDKINVTRFLNSWTTQSGFPLVTVERHTDRQTITVSQKQFLMNQPNHTDHRKWEIHLNYLIPSNINSTLTNSGHILGINNSKISFKLDQISDWVIFNVNQTGYYRVNYDIETWKNIGNALKNINYSGINPINRAQIVDDSFNLARSGYLNYSIVFKTLEYLKEENNYIAWLAALNNFDYITNRLNQTVLMEFKTYFINLSKNIYNKLGFIEKETDSRLDIYNRANILQKNCQYGNKNCIKLAKDEFDKFANKTQSVPVNIRLAVYCTAIAEGDHTEYSILKNKYLIEDFETEKLIILKALGCSRSELTVKEYISFLLSEHVSSKDKLTAFSNLISGQIENVSILLDYLIQNYQQSKKIFDKVILNLSSHIHNEEQIIKLENLFATHKIENKKFTDSIIKSAKLNLQWIDQNVPEIYRLLKEANNKNQ